MTTDLLRRVLEMEADIEEPDLYEVESAVIVHCPVCDVQLSPIPQSRPYLALCFGTCKACEQERDAYALSFANANTAEYWARRDEWLKRWAR